MYKCTTVSVRFDDRQQQPAVPQEASAHQVMSKPAFDSKTASTAAAKRAWKARLVVDSELSFEVGGWKAADANYSTDVVDLKISVGADGSLPCAMERCSANKRNFGESTTTRSEFAAHKHAT